MPVKLNDADVLFVGFDGFAVIVVSGAVLSIVYTWPVVNGTLLIAAPSPSVMPVDVARSSLNVPSPVIDETVTVLVVPDPVTALTVPATVPVVVVLKFAALPPVTLSLNVTVNCTLEAFVGFALARVIETTLAAMFGDSNAPISTVELSGRVMPR